MSVPKSAKKLKCVAERIDNWSKMRQPEATTKYRRAHVCYPKSRLEANEAKKKSTDGVDVVFETLVDPYADVLITIRVMCPLKYDPYVKETFKFDREIVVLGQQFLTEFRDQISCLCDTAGPLVDISDDPSADTKAQDTFAEQSKSGFLFIGNTFYDDMRSKENLECSKEIIAWAAKQPEMLEVKQAKMEETRFLDLKGIRLGFPYVFQHFGACEHVFFFSDIRVITVSDNLVRSDYPHLALTKLNHGIVCEICATYLASHLVTDSDQHIFNPVRLCGKCLNSYHYVDGKKLGKFKVHKLI